LKTYDESINFLRNSLDRTKVGDTEKIEGFKRLERFVNTVETKLDPIANFDEVIAHEKSISPSVGGRSVFDDKPRQGSLF